MEERQATIQKSNSPSEAAAEERMTDAGRRTLHAVTMDVRFSARYHMLVERWFLLLNDATTFVSLVLFSFVIWSLFKQIEWFAAAAAAVGALLQGVNLTLGSIRRAQVHRDLYKQYQELDAVLSARKLDLDAAEEAYRRLEINDPPVSSRFARIAYADNLKTHGYKDEAALAEDDLKPLDKLLRLTL